MFSSKARGTMDACRFCWMCRHVCPVGLVTGKEVNTARGKGLLLSLVERGEPYEESIAGVMWECVLCGSCSNDCATGYDPPQYIREARELAAAEGLAPEPVRKLMEQMLPAGMLYGTSAEEKLAALADDLRGLPSKAEVLLYIGDVAAVKAPELAQAAISLMREAGIAFTVLQEEPSSGAYLGDLIGFGEEVRRLGTALAQAIDASGASTVVVLDPIDARMMKHEYAQWDIAPKAAIRTATSWYGQLVREGKLRPVRRDGLPVVTFHDAGALTRDLDELEEGRALLRAMGYPIHEMFLARKLAKSSGGALLPRYAPELAAMVARARWDDALRTGAAVLVTEAPGSYVALGSQRPEQMEEADLLTLLVQACKTE